MEHANAITPPAPTLTLGQRAQKAGTWWKPGQSGNPAGRPRHFLISQALSGFYQANPTEIRRFILVAHKLALKGNAKFWELIADRIEGKVPQAISLSGTIHHEFAEDDRATIDQMRAIMDVIDIEPDRAKDK